MKSFNRKIGLGGSDAASALGFNQYCSPYRLWLEKTGREEPLEMSESAYWGLQLEDIIAKEYAKRDGVKVRKNTKTYYHKKYPFLYGHIDRKILKQNKLLECKTTNIFNKDKWGDDENGKLPWEYLMQVHFYMAVTDYDSADVALLIGGQRYYCYRVKRDKESENVIIDALADFWETHIVNDEPPDPSTMLDVRHRFKEMKEKSRIATFEEIEQVKNYYVLQSKKKKIDTHLDKIKIKLCAAIGENEGLLNIEEQPIVTWRPTKNGDRRFSVKSIIKEGINHEQLSF